VIFAPILTATTARKSFYSASAKSCRGDRQQTAKRGPSPKADIDQKLSLVTPPQAANHRMDHHQAPRTHRLLGLRFTRIARLFATITAVIESRC